jgi:transcriptional regulator with XRE-family HTH domain
MKMIFGVGRRPDIESYKMIDERVKTSDRLRAVMMETGTSYSELARLVGVSRQSVYRWRDGTVEPSLERLRQIADALRVPRTRLMLHEGQTYPTLVIQQEGEKDIRIVIRKAVVILIAPG